ncbi:MAG: fibronectin type III domain-containing protein [Bacteroidales bacterium]|nr:fibronectin type III domain-containing protein [Bacteroidales bacterium]
MKKILLLFSMCILALTSAFAQCDAPTNVQANAYWNRVNLSWVSPQAQQSCDDVLSYGGQVATGIGVSSTTPFTVAVRFPVSSLSEHDGSYLTKVSFILSDATVSALAIKIWTGGSYVGGVLNPGALVATVPVNVNNLVANTPNTVVLPNPIQIDASQELWIGYEVAAATSSVYPAAASDVELVGVNNLVELDGEWDDLASAGLPGYGWLIDGCIQITPPSLTGFNVFRDGVQLNESLLSANTTTYIDNTVSPLSSYCYEVQSVCSSTTMNSDQFCVNTPEQPNCGPMIGNGTGTTYYIPFNTYYNYSYVQELFEANELGATEGTIKSLTFNYFHSSPLVMNDITVYMANVENTTFASTTSWIPASELTQVFHGSVNCSNADSNKVTIDFDSDFEWDGQSNIVVAILNNQGSYPNSDPRFYTHSTTGNKVLYACQDGSAYDITAMGSGTLFSSRNNMQFCFGPAPTCYKPSSVNVSNITGEDATVSWTAHSPEDYQWEVVVAMQGEPVESGTSYTVTDTFANVVNLLENQAYDVYVRTVCSPSEQSEWALSSFRTRCVSTHEGIPYIDNFTDYGTGQTAFPYCWHRFTNNPTTHYPYISSASATLGQMVFYSNSQYYALATSQALDLSAFQGGSLSLSFWAGITAANYGRMDVGVMTDPEDINTLTVLKSFYPNDYSVVGSFEEKSILLTETYTEPIYLAFYAPVGNGENYVVISKIKVDAAPTCSAPVNLAVSEISGTSAHLTWDAAPYGVESYTLIYGESEGEMTSVEVQATDYRLSGLTQGAEYEVMLFSNCIEGEADTLVTSFTTELYIECSQIDTVGREISGTSTTTTYSIPVNNFFNYSYTQQIYTADEISANHTPTVITAIAFKYAYSSPSTNKNNVKIYLAHRSSDVFASSSDWTPIADATLVYEGALNCSQGWNKFDLTNYFNYNGNDNLVVIVDDNSGSYNGSSYVFNAHTNTDNKSLYYNSDGTNPDPVNPPSGTLSHNRSNVKFYCCDQIVPVACPAPYLYVSETAVESATIAWEANGEESEWNLEYRVIGTTDWDAEVVTSSPHTISGLLPNENYEIRLQAICTDENSEWATVTAFIPCESVELPINEDFEENTSNFVDCWQRLYSGTTVSPYISSTQSYSGSKSLYFNCPSSGNYAYAITSRLDDAVDMDNLMIQFYAYVATQGHLIEVGVMSDPNDVNSFTKVGQFMPSMIDVWELGEVLTSNYDGEGRYVALRVPQWNANNIFIDDLYVNYIPSCPHISNIQVNNVTATTADVTWTPGGEETQWNYVYGIAGTIDPETDPATPVTENSVALSELQSNTLYEIYVQADCDGGESTWMRKEFRTGCAAMTLNSLPYVENFDSYVGTTDEYENVLPNCWSRINNSSSYEGLPAVWHSASAAHSGNNSLYFYTDPWAADQYAILPEIDANELAINSLQLSFMARAYSSDYPFVIEVGLMSDPAEETSFVPVQTVQVIGTMYQEKEVYFDTYTGTGSFIALKVSSDDENYGYIDDMVLDLTPECSPVTNLSASNIAGASALISWQNGHYGTASSYTIELFDDEADAWNTITNDLTSTSYFLSGLEPLTTYMVRVKINCEDASESAWNTLSFTTRCLAGGEVAIGNGNSTNTYIPSYSFYNYGYSQQIYLASEMAGPTAITSVSLQMANLSQQRHYKIYLTHTTLSALSTWENVSNAQLMYDGTPNLQVGWNTFEFNAPFMYNGTDNLMLIFVDETGSYVSGNSWYTHTTNGTLARYDYDDNIQYGVATVPSDGTSLSVRNNVIFGGSCDATVTCIAPNMLVNNITTTTADVIWVPGYEETAWEMEYAVATDSVWTPVPNPTDGLVTLSALTANTPYNVRMRSVCDPDVSTWTMVDFRTECDVETIPFFENFDSYGTGTNAFPQCWTRHSNYSSTTSYPYITSMGGAGNVGALYFYASPSTYAMAITPELDAELSTMEVSFYFHSSAASNGMVVGVMTNPDDITTFVSVDTVYSVSSDEFDFFEVDLDNYTGNGKYVAFKTRNVSTNSMYLDEVTIAPIPSCKRPNEMAVSNIDMTSAEISWNERGEATSWIIEYGEPDFELGTGTQVLATFNPFTLTGLTSGTEYEVYVRSLCSSTDTSDYVVNSVVFATSLCSLSEQCEYRFVCKDGYGDGWNGAYATVKQNGVTVAIVEAEDHDLTSTTTVDTVRVMLCDNTPTTIEWTSGSYDGECSLALIAPSGEVLYNQNDMSAISSPILLDFTTNCGGSPVEVCDAPTNLQITSITTNSAVATWNAGGSETSWKVGYKLQSAGQWQEATVSTTTYSIEGLTANSTYDFRVKAICSTTSESDFVTTTFTTNPEVGIDNVELSNSINLMPNPADKYIELTVNSNVLVKEAVIYNAFGQMIQMVQLTDNHARINLDNYASGMYFVRIAGDNAVATKKFIKK